MFKKNDKQQQALEINQQEISTIIGEGFIFTGELRGSSAIRIEGKIIGNVIVDGGVILGEKGNVEGDIITKSAIIFGTVNGNVKTTQLEIKKTGFVNGEITTDTLEIELGAQYNGKLNMKRQPAQALAEAS
ncbi:polymer-forming cytoskeletal protein [Ginsengibacter hankyongi]|uniref:Polymer-forming cytoskeletal protein n=1 Tax=Ginsengibacter hankyongi TaxID=2607284 RepID=A0A5J5II67_9BACT|nr:polymer-forming cytoskeletal protein [Ginsengibacter hankyongi]KAA9040735.1 polymer-forming cytoskeletal protein [Ginsengibacter hankyongi]